MDRIRNDETRLAVTSTPWLEDCEIATWRGRTAIRLVGVADGGHFDTCIDHDGKGVLSSIDAFDHTAGHLAPTGLLDADIAAIETIEHAEDVEFSMHNALSRPTVRLNMPGAGHLDVEMGRYDDILGFIRRKVRERGQDGEGRTVSRLGAMTLAIGADGIPAVDRRIDTIFAGMKGRYDGVRYETGTDGRISTAVGHEGVQMRSDGIEISNLPETVRTGIIGRQRRRLAQVVDVPGFEGLEVDGISQRAMSSSRLGGRWVRIDVRDEHGAKFEQVEREEARRIAHETYGRRNP